MVLDEGRHGTGPFWGLTDVGEQALSGSMSKVPEPETALFEYVAWFRDSTLPPDDEDFEWPGIIYITAVSQEAARAWGDHLAKTCQDEFLRSTVAPQPGEVPAGQVSARDGEELTTEQIGW